MSAKPMTREEALVEARRRWGKGGAVHRHYLSGLALMAGLDGRGGVPQDGCIYIVRGVRSDSVKYGIGDSWEAAFADADRRKKGGAS